MSGWKLVVEVESHVCKRVEKTSWLLWLDVEVAGQKNGIRRWKMFDWNTRNESRGATSLVITSISRGFGDAVVDE